MYMEDFLLLAQTREELSYKKYSAFNSSPSLPMFYNKPQKILSKSNTGNLLPGFQHRFFVHGNFTPSGKGPQNSGLLQPPGNFPNRRITTSSKSDRTTGVLTPSHLACPTSFPPFTDGSNKRSADKPGLLLRLSGITITEFETGTRLVVTNTPSVNGSPAHLPTLDMMITTDAGEQCTIRSRPMANGQNKNHSNTYITWSGRQPFRL